MNHLLSLQRMASELDIQSSSHLGTLALMFRCYYLNIPEVISTLSTSIVPSSGHSVSHKGSSS